MLFQGATGEILNQLEISVENVENLIEAEQGNLRIFWNKASGAQIYVDGISQRLEMDQLVFLTEYHHLDKGTSAQGRLFRFNRIFYCLDNHDLDIGCKGILFFGAKSLPVVSLDNAEAQMFDLLWKVFALEIQSRDNLQLEMLRMLMKRWIILCIRAYKRQFKIEDFTDSKMQTIKEFSLLVEQHYRQMHNVHSYATLLNKSPKTLANTFAKINQKSPLQIIQDRVTLEARRLLVYSNKPVKEIAYALGFDDIHAFSRFFAKRMGMSPTNFRNEQKNQQLPA